MEIKRIRGQWAALILSLAFLGLWACGEDPDKLVIAQVGAHQVTQEELRRFVDGLPDGHRNRYQGKEARRNYLQSLIDEEFMWLEIKDRGLDTSLAALLPVKKTVRNQLVSIYQEREKLTQVSISPEEVMEVLRRRGLDQQKEKLASGIMTATKAEIKEVVEKLKAGEPFEEVALRHSITPQARLGGELGPIRLEAAQQMGIPDSIFHHLPEGEVSDYFPHAKGFFVVRFTHERPVDISQSEKAVFEELKGLKIGENVQVRAEQLAQELKWRVHPPGLALLLQQGEAALDIEAPEAGTPLYIFDKGQVSLADFSYALKGTRYKEMLTDSVAVAALFERLLMAPVLFEAAARRSGLAQEPAFVQWEKNQRALGLLETLRKIEVKEATSVTEQEMRQYYQEHKQLYYERDRFKVAEVLVKTEEEALQIQREVEAGADIVKLAKERSLRPEARREDAVLNGYASSELLPHVMKAKTGELVGPLKVSNGYSVFKILSRVKGDLQPFAQVSRQIKNIIRKRQEQEVFNQFIDGLRQKYVDQVQVYEDRLTLALPDEYLSEF
jgi:parvulin-like peptidyl-prolyl isomerase